jgi:putative CocE/NonD family hydrolase
VVCTAGDAKDLKAIYVSDIPLRDGVNLAADIYMPESNERRPAILVRTPYDPRLKPPIDFPKRLAEAGYVVVVNHCRGRYDSHGSFMPFKNEALDGFDVVEWIAKQPWSDGRVGLMGSSYSGIAGWQLAALKNPHLSAMFTIVAPEDLYKDIVYPGGAFSLATSFWWFSVVDRRTTQDWQFNNWEAALKHLPVYKIDEQLGRKFPVLRDMMDHPAYSQYWKDFYSMDGLYDQIDIPVFIVGGWNDSFVAGTLDTFSGAQRAAARANKAAGRVQALIGPWDHLGSLTGLGTVFGEIDYGVNSAVDVSKVAVDWFDRWFKNKRQETWQSQPLKYFQTGSNQWKQTSNWPPPAAAEESYYLHSAGSANTSAGDGRLSRQAPADEPDDKFRYDPLNPVPSVASKHILLSSSVKNIASIESRSDLLVYTSEVLENDLIVEGNPRLVLEISSDAPDTDFNAWLTEVGPDGRSLSLLDGAVRCSTYLKPKLKNSQLNPSERYEVVIELGSLAHVFKSGNRLRLDLSSSSFPEFDRNLNNGKDNCKEDKARVATQVVMHNRVASSQLILPVVH